MGLDGCSLMGWPVAPDGGFRGGAVAGPDGWSNELGFGFGSGLSSGLVGGGRRVGGGDIDRDGEMA